MTLGKEVRLKNAYIIKGEEVIKDDAGNVLEIICSYDPLSKSGSGTEESQRKVKGTLHWVSCTHSKAISVNLYDRLFSVPEPDQNKDEDPSIHINPNSLKTVQAFIEPNLVNTNPGTHFQFQRLGYFIVDTESSDQNLIFNRTVGLRDTWQKK